MVPLVRPVLGRRVLRSRRRRRTSPTGASVFKIMLVLNLQISTCTTKFSTQYNHVPLNLGTAVTLVLASTGYVLNLVSVGYFFYFYF